jgi:hypothetical protein
MGAEQEPHNVLIPSAQSVFGQRFEELKADLEGIFQAPWLAAPFVIDQRDQASHRLRAAGDNDLFALASLFDQLGKIGLGLVDGKGLRLSKPALC